MNYRMIFSSLGKLMISEAILLLLPFGVSLIYKENLIWTYLIPIFSLALIGGLLLLIKPKKKTFYAKEGFVLVGLSWILISLFGCLPFIISGRIPHFVDAFFETVSGFTTTGASIVDNIDTWYEGSKGLLFWRSFLHWIGGMGILVFILALLPQSEGQNIFILKAESTGPKVGKLVSKVKLTARILYLIYFGMTIIEIVFLTCDPEMSFFDALLHSFGTAGTGGFGIRSTSLGEYSIYSQIVIAVFMFLFGINFNLYYLILIRKWKQAFKSEELWVYAGIMCASTLVICLDIFYTASLGYSSFAIALKDSFFQVSSIMTTTGFSTVDFSAWPMLSRMILVTLMFIGGCAGSTAGGIKVARIGILMKSLSREIRKLVHPNSVSQIRFEDTTVDEDTVKGVYNYFALLISIFVLAIFIVSLDGYDFETTFTSVAACINNIGPGLGKIVGPAASFSKLSVLSKLTLIVSMLIGRLEIYPILILINPKVWLNR